MPIIGRNSNRSTNVLQACRWQFSIPLPTTWNSGRNLGKYTFEFFIISMSLQLSSIHKWYYITHSFKYLLLYLLCILVRVSDDIKNVPQTKYIHNFSYMTVMQAFYMTTYMTSDRAHCITVTTVFCKNACSTVFVGVADPIKYRFRWRKMCRFVDIDGKGAK